MPMLKVYGFSRVNPVARGNTRDLRVLWALEEMQMPFELVGMDHPAKAMSTDAYRALSPFEQIPAIDDDGVVLSESAAILIHLAKKAGKLIPDDAAGEMQVIRWCFVAMNTVEFPLLNIQLIDAFGDDDAGAKTQREKMVKIADRHLTGLQRWLEGREFITSGMFTVADILMAHVLGEVGADFLEPYPHVLDYRERCKSRPAWRKTIDTYCARVEAA